MGPSYRTRAGIEPGRRTRSVCCLLVARMIVVVVAVLAALLVPGAVAGAANPAKCNGSVRLCDVPLGDVAFATTHNSMSSPADHFFGPNQGRPIKWQLDHGIHGFQIDAYEGVARKGRVYTELSGPFGSQATDLPAPLVALATRIHRRLGAPPSGTPTDVYLCHSFCEIGAVRFSTIARQMRTFLDAHPRDVLAVVIEDSVSPARIRGVLAAAGLDRELVTVVPGAPLPTLGALIRSGQRLLVALENGDGGPTMPNAFGGLVEETPFTFLTASALADPSSCAANRGGDASPVFQLNHWVTPPSPGRARLVNRSALRSRVLRCMEERGRVPTLVAVDFAETSTVLAVVDEINRG
jgi:hypothetical protein